MRVLIVTGIWPPDVGGPASHAPEVAAFLQGLGHRVEVLTTADRPPAPAPHPVRWVSRAIPIGLRHVAGTFQIARHARAANVVYSTGMFGRSAIGAALARRPLVVKLTGDPAFERARNRRLHRGSLEDFQRAPRGRRVGLLLGFRNWSLRRARHIFCPSAYLREVALGWGIEPARVSVLPNPAPSVDSLAQEGVLRDRLGVEGGLLVFAGRLTAQKALPLALEAVARAGDVSLVLAGDGPDRAALERRADELGLGARARFLGPHTRAQVLELFRAGDAALLSSTWENFPHTVVEALAAGTPVIATDTGGVGEVVRHEGNGLLVAPGDVDALAGAIRRFFDDDALRARLRAAAAPSVADYAPERVYERLDEVLREVAGRTA